MYSNADGYDAHVPPGTPHLVHFLRGADPSASVACSGGKVFHEACDSKSYGFSLPEAPAPPSAAGRSAAGRSDDEDGADVTNDVRKTESAVRLLREYATNRSRFFLAVGYSATHVMRPAALCR